MNDRRPREEGGAGPGARGRWHWIPGLPGPVFCALVPWLILFATAVFCWSSFRQRHALAALWFGPVPFACVQDVLAV